RESGLRGGVDHHGGSVGRIPAGIAVRVPVGLPPPILGADNYTGSQPAPAAAPPHATAPAPASARRAATTPTEPPTAPAAGTPAAHNVSARWRIGRQRGRRPRRAVGSRR